MVRGNIRLFTLEGIDLEPPVGLNGESCPILAPRHLHSIGINVRTACRAGVWIFFISESIEELWAKESLLLASGS